MNILVTGGAGFIGSHLVEHFQDSAGEIRVLDNLRTGSKENLRGLRHTFIEGSVTDRETVAKAAEGIDLVFHLAALVSVEESIAKPQETVEINVTGLLNVIQAATAAGVRKLVFASSAAVYGNNPVDPKTEDMLPEPMSPYAISKLDGEHYLRIAHDPQGMETCSIRFFNVFGPRQDPNGGYAAAVPIFLQRARKNKILSIFGDGGQTRDFIYVKDIVNALVFAATTPLKGTYNAGYGKQIRIDDLARTIIGITGSKSSVEHLPARAGDVRHSRACVDRLLAAGWEPRYGLEEALNLTAAGFA